MTVLKKLMIVTALLAGESSLAMAQQYGGPNGSQPLVTAPSGMPSYGLTAAGPGYVPSGTAQRGPTGYGGPTGSNRLVTAPSGMPTYGLAASGPSAHHHSIKDHRRIYMSTKSRL